MEQIDPRLIKIWSFLVFKRNILKFIRPTLFKIVITIEEFVLLQDLDLA